MSVQLLRNTRLWVSTAVGSQAITSANTFEILMGDDFSFSQDGNSSDVNLSEAGPKPTRGSASFRDSLNPADWSFSTYLRPYIDDLGTVPTTDDRILTPDYALWHSLASGSPVDLAGTNGVTTNGTNMLVKFTDNQHHELNKLTLFYLVDNEWYKIEGAQVNQLEISFDIEGIGTASWSGQGTKLVPLGSVAPFAHTTAAFTFPDAIFNSASYIKNKLTIMDVVSNTSSRAYEVAITGGSITISNNITYLTPSTLSRLDTPIGSFTGSFQVNGSLEAYIRTRNPGDPANKYYSADLVKDLLEDLSITPTFKLGVYLGGRYATAAPGVCMVLPRAFMNTPSVDTQDVLSTSIDFTAQGSDMDAGDEIYFGMSPKYTADEIAALFTSGDGHNHYLTDPAITGQPTGATLSVGNELTLTVAGTDITTYQWYKDGVAISGANAATYTVAAATLADAGSYYVQVANSGGETLDSNTVTVTVS